ncbi:MAG: hypothetical protein H6813_05455 [Phycisphaeraceae bacterium]|nr:hypothetical protein [Phycisphaeraceae bacterium]
MQVMHQLVDGFVRDGSHAGFGFRFGAMGASVNGSVAFKPGTQGARLFTRGGDSGSLLSKLPGGPFLAAFAMDQTAPFAKATMEWFQKSGMADMNPAMGAMGMRDLQNNMTGVAGAIYPNSAGIMGGLLANMIMYSASDDPGKLMAMTRDKMSAMNVNEPALGMSITASYTPGETNIAGKKADGYAINFAMAGMDAAGAMFNPMSMIFGSPNGPSGYLIEANGGVYQSFSRNSTMLAPAVEGRSPLTDDRAVAEVAGRLPKNRYAEAYIGVRPIMEQVMPFLGMLGVPPMDLPAQMPPVGLGVASRDGGAVFGAFVPSQTIKSAIQIGMSAQNAVGGFGGNDNGPGF